jgi:hypothetical protein
MQRSYAPPRRARVGAARGLAAGGCVLALVAAVGMWAREQLLDTDRWVQTSDDLLREPAIRDELARYVADRVARGTPYRDRAEQAARRLLTSPPVEAVWRDTNRAAHARFVMLIRDDRDADVFLELRPLLVQLGRQIGLPTALLPATAGQVRVLRADQLDTARTGAETLETAAWWSLALAVAALAAALLLGGTRVLVTMGIGLGLVALLLVALRELGGSFVAGEVARRGGGEDAAGAAWSVGTSLLGEIAIGLAIAGALSAAFGLVARARA